MRAWVAPAVLLASMLPAGAVTNDFYLTTRSFLGGTVVLKPLVAWLKNKSAGAESGGAERPLPAWKVVRIERIIRTNADWAVSAEVDGARREILLRNPPQRELAEFNQLKAQYKQLTEVTNRLEKALPRAEAQQRQAIIHAEAVRRSTFKWGANNEAQASVQVLTSQINLLRRDLDAARQQLAFMEGKGYDLSGSFVFDCLALETDGRVGSRTVFDRGQPH